MELNEAQKILEVSKEDESLVKKYLGFMYANINILGNLDMDNYYRVSKTGGGRKLPKTKEEIEEAISEFVNLYAVIYKQSKGQHLRKDVVRGTEIGNVNNTSQFLSTSKSTEIAKRFGDPNSKALVSYKIEEGVPFIDAEKYREKDSANEQEIIIAPFCEITDVKSNTFTYGDFYQYTATIKKANLEKVEESELDALYDELVDGFEQNVKNINSAGNLEETLRYKENPDRPEEYGNDYELFRKHFERKLKSAELEYSKAKFYKDDKKAEQALEEKEYYLEKIEQNKQEENEAKKRVSEVMKSSKSFSQKMRRLLMGLCKQKELEIDKALETVEKQNMMDGISSRLPNAPENADKLEKTIINAYQNLSTIESSNNNMARRLGIKAPRSMSETNIGHSINIITENIKTARDKIDITNQKKGSEQSFEEVKELSDQLVPLLDGISFGIEITKNFPDIINMYKSQTDIDLKRNLYLKVQGIIRDARIQKYEQEKKDINNQKVGILGKITGADKLKEERLKNINLKIRALQTEVPQDQTTYSVRDMLADIHACAISEFAGELTPEMKQMSDAIRANFVDKKVRKFHRSIYK